MPESASADITSSLRDFLLFYANDLFFRTTTQPFDNWTSWLSHTANIPRINPRQSPIFIEGESAGGHAAIITAFINAEKGGKGLPVKVALLRFPMVAHYTRTFGPNMKYMSHEVSKKEAETQVRKLEEEIAKLENYGLVPTRVKGYAPDKMAGAFLLSTMGRWKSVFQRVHGPYTHDIVKAGDIEWPVNGDVEQTWDCIERAEGSVGKVDHAKLPPMVIYHGDKDGNCPIEDTERFVGVLKAKYPARYNDNTAYLKKVTYLSGKEKPVGSQTPVTEVNHAFDYQILEEYEPWLKDVYDKVDAHWTAS
jgi:acetyl esterase/lipase